MVSKIVTQQQQLKDWEMLIVERYLERILAKWKILSTLIQFLALQVHDLYQQVN